MQTDRRRDQAELRRFVSSRDPQLREQLVRRYLPLARHAAWRFSVSGESLDELIQVASLGLLKALDGYDPDRGTTFSSYAVPTMLGELRRHFRDRTWSVRPPRELQDRALVIERRAETLHQELGRPPTMSEIGARCGLSPEEMFEAREALAARRAASLSVTILEDEEGAAALEEHLGIDEVGYEQAEGRCTVATLSRVLSDRERLVVELRFRDDLTQAEIGAIVGVSQMQVSRILRRSIEKLRAAAGTPSAR